MSESQPLRIVLWGASGAMGGAVIRQIAATSQFRLAGAICSAGSEHLGEDAGERAGLDALGVPLADEPAAGGDRDIILDVSLPSGSLRAARYAVQAGLPLVVGATGFDAEQRRQLEDCAVKVPLLIAPNFSILVGVLAQTLQMIRQFSDARIAISETHHKNKRDLPSGTARELAARSGTPASEVVSLRDAQDTGLTCTYRVEVNAPGERQVIEYSADADRSCFARGALQACQWLCGRAAGLYQQQDMYQQQDVPEKA